MEELLENVLGLVMCVGGVASVFWLLHHSSELKVRNRKEFAGLLEQGHSEGCYVRGRRAGRRVELSLPGAEMKLEVEVRDAGLELSAEAVSGRGEEAALLAQELSQRGVLTVSGGVVRLRRQPPWTSPPFLRGCLTRLVALAALLEAPRIDVKIAGVVGGAPRCPYCRDDLDPEAEVVSPCGKCGTPHHAACLREAGGCTVLACRGRPGRAVRG